MVGATGRSALSRRQLGPQGPAGGSTRTEAVVGGTDLGRLGITNLGCPGGTTAESFHRLGGIEPQTSCQGNGPFQESGPYEMQAASTLRHVVLDRPLPSRVGRGELGRLLAGTGIQGTVVVDLATDGGAEAADLVAYLTAPLPSRPSRSPAKASRSAALRAVEGHGPPLRG